MRLIALCTAACTLLLPAAVVAQTATESNQMSGMKMAPAAKPMLSPPATATVDLNGQQVIVKYNAPSMRGRKIMGGLVPWNQVWRTGANPATTLITPVPLHIGLLLVPAGTYTLYTLPGEKTWQLIVNKETGQWGTIYHQAMDLGRVPMKGKTLKVPQETMSISFDDTRANSTELHIRWESTDESIKIATP